MRRKAGRGKYSNVRLRGIFCWSDNTILGCFKVKTSMVGVWVCHTGGLFIKHTSPRSCSILWDLSVTFTGDCGACWLCCMAIRWGGEGERRRGLNWRGRKLYEFYFLTLMLNVFGVQACHGEYKWISDFFCLKTQFNQLTFIYFLFNFSAILFFCSISSVIGFSSNLLLTFRSFSEYYTPLVLSAKHILCNVHQPVSFSCASESKT